MYIQKGAQMIAVGILPHDAEFKQVGAKNTNLCKFSIKVDEISVDGSDKKEAKWLNCICWYRLAKYAACLEKGDTVMVAGVLKDASYTNKKTGEYVEKKELDCAFVLPQPSAEDLIAPDASEPDGDTFTEDNDDDGEVPF